MTTNAGNEGSTARRTVDRTPTPRARLFVCAECRHAQLFAVQPKVLCTGHGAPFEHEVLFAGRPACASMLPRRSAEPFIAGAQPARGVTRRLTGTPGV